MSMSAQGRSRLYWVWRWTSGLRRSAQAGDPHLGRAERVHPGDDADAGLRWRRPRAGPRRSPRAWRRPAGRTIRSGTSAASSRQPAMWRALSATSLEDRLAVQVLAAGHEPRLELAEAAVPGARHLAVPLGERHFEGPPRALSDDELGLEDNGADGLGLPLTGPAAQFVDQVADRSHRDRPGIAQWLVDRRQRRPESATPRGCCRHRPPTGRRARFVPGRERRAGRRGPSGRSTRTPRRGPGATSMSRWRPTSPLFGDQSPSTIRRSSTSTPLDSSATRQPRSRSRASQPVERAGDEADATGAAGDEVVGRDPPDGQVVDRRRSGACLSGHPADEHDRDREVGVHDPGPRAVVADLGDRPDDAVHAA